MLESKMLPYLALFIGVLTVSASAIFVKLVSAPAEITAFYRLLISTVIVFPWFWRKRKALYQFAKSDWIYSMLAGVFLAFHFILWFESLEYTSVASSVVLVTLQPLFAFVGTYFFFKEKVTFGGLASAGFAIVGSAIISWGDFKVSGLALWGDILALIACAMVTAYLLCGQHLRKKQSLAVYTFVVYGVSSATLFIYCLFSGESFVSYPSEDWIYFVLLAIFPTLLGHSLFNWSIKWISTNMVSVSILFEPVGASILAYYVLREMVTASQIVGGSMILAGILFFIFEKRMLRLYKSFSLKKKMAKH
ncbi:DMT family transporter [Bacillus gobiensis]|uniref:DMT family transporter n=1 Tax=Bacillus gobiensis TaxID=1441095 RepID=UPI003D1EDA6A